jgi:hypothetical protein
MPAFKPERHQTLDRFGLLGQSDHSHAAFADSKADRFRVH